MHLDSEGSPLCQGSCPAAKTVIDGRDREAQIFLRHKEGYRLPVLVRVSPVRDETGTIIGAAEIFTSNADVLRERRLIAELKRMALIDPLTEIGNRRYLEQGLVAKLSEQLRFGWPLGALMMDIDHFKRVNDEHGHATGDRVLRMVARTLESNMRSFDLLGRWGGEEFLALFINTDRDRLFAVGNKLRLLVSQSMAQIDGQELNVTISIGGALALPDDTPQALVARADNMMYRAKKAGRNHIIVGEA